MILKILEFIPSIAFFIAYKFYVIIYATIVMVVLTLVSVIATVVVSKKKPSNMVLFSLILVLITGSLTVFTSDADFIKMKPTFFYGICAITLSIGLLYKKFFIRSLFGSFMELSDKKWNSLSLQWIVFFIISAIGNEFIRSIASDDLWVNYKIIFMPIAMSSLIIFQIITNRQYLKS